MTYQQLVSFLYTNGFNIGGTIITSSNDIETLVYSFKNSRYSAWLNHSNTDEFIQAAIEFVADCAAVPEFNAVMVKWSKMPEYFYVQSDSALSMLESLMYYEQADALAMGQEIETDSMIMVPVMVGDSNV